MMNGNNRGGNFMKNNEGGQNRAKQFKRGEKRIKIIT